MTFFSEVQKEGNQELPDACALQCWNCDYFLPWVFNVNTEMKLNLTLFCSEQLSSWSHLSNFLIIEGAICIHWDTLFCLFPFMFQHLHKHIFNCWPGHFQWGEQILVWLLNPKMLSKICFLTSNSANFLILECHPWLCLTLSIKDAWKAQIQASYWGIKVNLKYDNKSRINLVTFSNLPSTPTAVNQSYFVSARVWQTIGDEIIVIHVWCVGQLHYSIVLTYKK